MDMAGDGEKVTGISADAKVTTIEGQVIDFFITTGLPKHPG